MKYYLNATSINFGDPVSKVFDSIDEVEDFILLDHSHLEDIRVIRGELLDFELRVNWK